MTDVDAPAEIDELKYKLDGCRHILRQAGYPAMAPLLDPLGAFGFALLELTTREPGFADLIAQNPALAIAFVWLRPSMGFAAPKPGSWKQRDLAGELGFRPEAARILARIVPSAITLERLDLVRRLPLEARTGLQGLQQAKSINAITFALLGEPEWQTNLSDRVIQEVGEIRSDRAEAFSWLLGSVLKTLKHENRALPRIRSYRDLARLLSLAFPLAVHIGPVVAPEAAPAVAPVVVAKERRKRYFPVPFPGGEGIEPLDTVEEILEEGRLQRNCIGLGHVRRVSHGGAYLYRVVHPSRCSLMITRDRRRSRGWVIADLKGFSNQSPDAATVAAVDAWFAAVTGGQMTQRRAPVNRAPAVTCMVWDIAELGKTRG